MPFIPAPEGTVRCVHHFTVQGQECLVVPHVEVNTAPTAADLLDLANDLFGAWQTHMLPNQASEITFDYVHVTDVEIQNGLEAQSNVAPAAGGSANPSINNGLAGVIALRTPFSGRSNRGRIYVPGLRNDLVDTDSNYWTTAFVTELQNDSAAWLAAVEALTPGTLTSVSLVITSYYSGVDPVTGDPIPRATAVNTGVTSTAARRRIGSQRRRRPRV